MTSIRQFWNDRRGHFAMMTTIAIIPLLGGLALAIDFSELTRQKQETLNALDAAGIATARRIVDGATDTQLLAYAQDFFEANLNSVDPKKAQLTVVLPKNNTGGGTLKLSAQLQYDPYFFPAFTTLVHRPDTPETRVDFTARTEIRLKNTLEVALVLDNSGSMDYTGTGSGQKRIDLLKDAAKELVRTLAAEGQQMKQLAKPVQFALVPFAASVNVGPANADKSWMDTSGLSPVHHENFDWSTINSTNKYTELSGGVRYARGSDWGSLRDKALTRFTLYSNVKKLQSETWVPNLVNEKKCIEYKRDGVTCKTWKDNWVDYGHWDRVYTNPLAWEGCIESRPAPYNTSDVAPSSGTPATLFVPMFAPDEADGNSAPNNWWKDSLSSGNAATRQKYMPKYFEAATINATMPAAHAGPNESCTVKPITPLTDVTVATGLTSINNAIDAMGPLGATNVPEGMAWGWRTISHGEPFTEGRPDHEHGNDKVLIVLTDGANTYYTPEWFGNSDNAGNKSTYSSYGYAGKVYSGATTSRMFMSTTSPVSSSTYSNANYTAALNQHFAKLCDNAKAAKVLVITVALDLNANKTDEAAQIEMMRSCSSDSRFKKDTKLFWNATGATLGQSFREIADELSNLRIVG